MSTQPSKDWEGLRAICRRLRAPNGCTWDRGQTLETVTPYLLEEAHELIDAIGRRDRAATVEELGDLLYLLVFLVTIAEEEGRFRFEDVAVGITTKLIRRHPHVFGDTPETLDPEAVRTQWETIKASEREDAEQGAKESATGTSTAGPPDRHRLACGARGLPALLAAYRVQEKAASFGFDWPDLSPVLAKLDEEREELGDALRAEGALAAGDATVSPPVDDPPPREAEGTPRGRIAGPASQHELGDVLFAAVNLARHIGADPEVALRGTIDRFRSRFAGMEAVLEAEGHSLKDADLDTMERAWQAAKRTERADAAER